MNPKPNGLFFIPPLEDNFWGHIFEEVYKTHLFDSVLPKAKEGTVAIDVGANVGIVSHYFSSKFEKVYSIEPSTRHYDVLKYMLDYNEIKNVFPQKFALSAKDGESDFYLYSNRTMDSLYGNIAVNNQTGLVQTGTEKVTLKRIDTFMEEQKIEHVDLLKLDCEGVEFEILGGEGFAKIAPKIDTLVAEVHSFSGRNPNQLIDSLKINGFQVQVVPHDATLIVARRT